MSDAAVRMQFRDQGIVVGEFPDGYTLEVAAMGLELTIRDGSVIIATPFDEPLSGEAAPPA